MGFIGILGANGAFISSSSSFSFIQRHTTANPPFYNVVGLISIIPIPIAGEFC